jgi:diguanylate cyclase (GGDEF)-like protein
MATLQIATRLAGGPGANESIRVLVAGDVAYKKSVGSAFGGADIALIEHVETADELLQKIRRGDFDCIVADATVGDCNSLELRESIEQTCQNAPPMILLTENVNLKTVLKAFRNGISDYVPKDHDFAIELLSAVRRAVERNRKTRALIDEIDHLATLANYDRLTGLPNRTLLDDRLLSLIASGERHSEQFSIFLIDINNFKHINDVHGVAAGDQVLRAFAHKLMLASRSSDTIGRVRGDEFFCVIDRGVSEDAVELACVRLSSALSFSVQLDAVDLALTASIGAAIYPADGKTSDALLKAAAQGKYAAKANGSGYCLAGTAPSAAPADDANADPATRPVRAAGAHAGTTLGATPGGAAGRRDENRRSEHRHRVFKRGRIILGDGYSTINCVVRDLSARGARVTVDGVMALPPDFSFTLLDTGAVHVAMRRWQRGRSVGIEFSAEGTQGVNVAAG